jgi:hypothetical protein
MVLKPSIIWVLWLEGDTLKPLNILTKFQRKKIQEKLSYYQADMVQLGNFQKQLI